MNKSLLHRSTPARLYGVLALSLALSACGGSDGTERTTGNPPPPTPGAPVFLMSEVALLAGGAGGPGSLDGEGAAARFDKPLAIAAGKDGNLYVADAGNRTIRKVSPSGLVTTIAGRADDRVRADGIGRDARFGSPEGIAVDNDGNLYVMDICDTYCPAQDPASTIRKITPNGTVTTIARFGNLAAIAAGPDNSIYVVVDRSVQMLTPEGRLTTLVGEQDGAMVKATLQIGGGIAVDSDKNLYFVSNRILQKVTPTGVMTALAGSPGTLGTVTSGGPSGSVDGQGSAARFNDFTGGIQVDSAGNIYIADSQASTIRKVTANGQVTTLAGLTDTPGSTDGNASAARFRPSGIALDGKGNLYVAEAGNHTIRKLSASGDTTTLAGLAASPLPPEDEYVLYGLTSPQRIVLNQKPAAPHAVDKAGNLYVAVATASPVQDWFYAEQLRKVAPDGTISNLGDVVVGGFNRIAVNEQGSVYGQLDTCRVPRWCGIYPEFVLARLDSSGKWESIVWGSKGSGAPERAIPHINVINGLAVDNSGNVLVTQRVDNKVLKITPQRQVLTLAGGSAGFQDGTGEAAQFSGPEAIAVDSNGVVFVADSKNSTIRRIMPDGAVTTVAGVPGQRGTRLGKAPNNLPPITQITVIGPNTLAAHSANNILKVTF